MSLDFQRTNKNECIKDKEVAWHSALHDVVTKNSPVTSGGIPTSRLKNRRLIHLVQRETSCRVSQQSWINLLPLRNLQMHAKMVVIPQSSTSSASSYPGNHREIAQGCATRWRSPILSDDLDLGLPGRRCLDTEQLPQALLLKLMVVMMSRMMVNDE